MKFQWFLGYSVLINKYILTELLNYAKNTLKNISQIFKRKSNTVPGMCRWSSSNSVSDWSRNYSALNQQDLNSDNESDEEVIKTTHEEDLSVGYKYFEFLKKQNYTSEQEVITVQSM